MQAKQNETSQRMADLEARRNQLTVERDQLSVRAATLQQCLAQRQATISGSQQEECSQDGGDGSTSTSRDSPKSVRPPCSHAAEYSYLR